MPPRAAAARRFSRRRRGVPHLRSLLLPPPHLAFLALPLAAALQALGAARATGAEARLQARALTALREIVLRCFVFLSAIRGKRVGAEGKEEQSSVVRVVVRSGHRERGISSPDAVCATSRSRKPPRVLRAGGVESGPNLGRFAFFHSKTQKLEVENLRVLRAFGGAATAPGARDFLGTRTFLGGEDDARACAGAWGRDPGRVAHASATPIARRVPKACRMGVVGEKLQTTRPGGHAPGSSSCLHLRASPPRRWRSRRGPSSSGPSQRFGEARAGRACAVPAVVIVGDDPNSPKRRLRVAFNKRAAGPRDELRTLKAENLNCRHARPFARVNRQNLNIP